VGYTEVFMTFLNRFWWVESFLAGPTGSEAVYTVDLVICARAHVVAVMFVLSGPNAMLWCGIELKYVTSPIYRTRSL